MVNVRQRIRLRFRKEGDLRLISHRDLQRALERLFRRAALQLGLSEGFHPKARISFPSALALGIRGLDEVVELELADPLTAEELLARLSPHCPPGLVLTSARVLDAGEGKAQVAALTYEMPVPAERHARLADAIEHLLAESSHTIASHGREPIDVRAGLDQLDLVDGMLRFRLIATRSAGVRPGEVLDVLELADLLDEGYYLTRNKVELTPPSKPKIAHEKGNVD